MLYEVHRSLPAMPSTFHDASTYPAATRAGMKITAHASATERSFTFGPLLTRPGEWVTTFIDEAMAGVALSEIDHVAEFMGDAVDAYGIDRSCRGVRW